MKAIHTPTRNPVDKSPNLKIIIQQNSPSFILESARESLKSLDKGKIIHSQPQRRHFLLNSWKNQESPSSSPQIFFQKEESYFFPKPISISRAHSAYDSAIPPYEACFSPEYETSMEMKRRCTIDNHTDEKKEMNTSRNSLGKTAKAFIIKHKGIFSPETRSRGASITGLQGQEISLSSPEKESPNQEKIAIKSFLEDTENNSLEEKGKEYSIESFSKIRFNSDLQESKGKLINCSIFSRLHKSNKSTSPESKEETISCATEESIEVTENEKKSIFFQTKRKGSSEKSEKTFDVKIGEVIGEGAYGEVYKVLNTETGEFLAMKRVRSEKQGDDLPCLDILSFHREIDLYRNLEHKHIVKYLGTKQEGDKVNIYMEFMPGGSVSSMLKQYGSFEENVIRKFTKQILFGLEYLHGQGVIHRDIKGANILSDASGTVKLADFGAAKYIDYTELLASVTDSDGYASIKGSLYWMAPELLNQQKHGRKIDIWSLGCTVIEMATARRPWPYTKNYTELVMDMVTQRHPPIPDHLSDDAKDFIKQCCQFEKKLRPTASELLNHPFVKDY